MQEKYGFIYLWFDKKYKKFYIGRHWGTEYDGYVCSSNSMREAHRRRPEDFKRRIIKKIYSSIEDLVLEEQRWLNMIKPSECCVKYYNKTLKSSTPSTRGYRHSEETRRKISASNKGKIISEEMKQKLREANKVQFEDINQREIRKQKSKELWSNPEYRNKQLIARSIDDFYKGFNKNHSEETKQKLREKMTGKTHNDETKEKLSNAFSNMIWINNGNINKRISKSLPIPYGFVKGRF